MQTRNLRLDETLSMWERCSAALQAFSELARLDGAPEALPSCPAFRNWQSFRRALLGIHSADRFPTSQYRYGPDPDRIIDAAQEVYLAASTIDLFSVALACWIKHSRRVYQVTRPLQAILNATSLRDIRWRDIHWPFSSFVISLEQPIVGFEGTEYDGILVANTGDPFFGTNEDRNDVQILLLPRLPRGMPPFTQQERDRINDILCRGRRREVKALSDKLWDFYKIRACPISSFKIGSLFGDEPVMESLLKTYGKVMGQEVIYGPEEGFMEINAAARIVAGLVFYMQTLPPGSPHIKSVRPPVRLGKPDPRAIAVEAEVCSVHSSIPLSDEEVRVFLGYRPRSGHEVCAHFVEGHYRRPPGYGNDPSMPRIVPVRPFLRRTDRLKEGEIPGGLDKRLH